MAEESTDFIKFKDIKGVLVLVALGDGTHQVLTNRKTELTILKIIENLSTNLKLNLVETPLAGIEIDFPDDVQSFQDYIKNPKKR
jgi:hypothetical protein